VYSIIKARKEVKGFKMTERYVSKTGFVKLPILRGINEIEKLLEICNFTTANKAFILGGYVRWMCSPKENPVPAGDIDIYCENPTIFELLKTTLLGKNLVIKNDNPMALTFELSELAPVPIQLIKPINQGAIVAMGDIQTILSHFDFTVIRIGILDSQTALADADFLYDEQNNLLRLKNIHCPISSTLRCMKYAKKGYFLRPVECLKLFADWTNRSIQYQQQIISGLQKIEDNEQLTQEDIDELERLMRID
jgi:hypothetical protein